MELNYLMQSEKLVKFFNFFYKLKGLLLNSETKFYVG